MFMILMLPICIAGQSEDPVYLRVLPDGDHESCSVDVTDASKAVDTTDADTHTADPTDSKQKKKLLRKEDSGTTQHKMKNYMYLYVFNCTIILYHTHTCTQFHPTTSLSREG